MRSSKTGDHPILGYSRKYPHTPMDDTGNHVRNAQWVWLEIHKFLQNFVNFNRNSGKTIQIFAKFCNHIKLSPFQLCNNCDVTYIIEISFLENNVNLPKDLLMDQTHCFLLETAIKYGFNCIFAFKLWQRQLDGWFSFLIRKLSVTKRL